LADCMDACPKFDANTIRPTYPNTSHWGWQWGCHKSKIGAVADSFYSDLELTARCSVDRNEETFNGKLAHTSRCNYHKACELMPVPVAGMCAYPPLPVDPNISPGYPWINQHQYGSGESQALNSLRMMLAAGQDVPWVTYEDMMGSAYRAMMRDDAVKDDSAAARAALQTVCTKAGADATVFEQFDSRTLEDGTDCGDDALVTYTFGDGASPYWTSACHDKDSHFPSSDMYSVVNTVVMSDFRLGPSMQPFVKRMTKQLQTVAQQSGCLEAGMTLYRGRSHPFTDYPSYALLESSYNNQAEIRSSTYMSTSPEEHTCESFGPHCLTLEVKKRVCGVAADMSMHSRRPGELEVLLVPYLPFRVTSIDTTSKTQKITMTLGKEWSPVWDPTPPSPPPP